MDHDLCAGGAQSLIILQPNRAKAAPTAAAKNGANEPEAVIDVGFWPTPSVTSIGPAWKLPGDKLPWPQTCFIVGP